MISSSAKTIRQYCSVCKATLDMAVVDTVQDNDVTWLKCPRCSGILPHMISRDETPEETVAESQPEAPLATASPAPAPAGIPQAERDSARDYDSAATFEVGEVVYHRPFNQHGRVTEKTALPGQRAAIQVQFENGDILTLREGQ